MTTIKEDTPRNAPPAILPRTLSSKISESVEKGRTVPKLFEMNVNKPKEAFVEPIRAVSPPPLSSIVDQEETATTENKVLAPEDITIEHPLAVRLIKQNKEFASSELLSFSPVLIESTLLLMPEQSQTQVSSSDQQPLNTSAIIDDTEQIPSNYRRATTHRVHVPVHNAAQWFNGPNMQNERSGRLEKVVSSLFRRSFRPMSNYAMPRVPTLTSPSSREHAQLKGVRPGTLQDFCIESQRLTPTPFMFSRQSTSAKGRYTPSARSYDFHNSRPGVFRIKSLFNQPCPTPSWM